MSSIRTALAFVLFLAEIFVCNDASAQQIRDLNAQYRRALSFERNGHYANAAEMYETLFRLKPQNNSYYQGLLRNLNRLGRYGEAVEIVQQRLKVVDDALGRANLGSAYYKLENQQQALQVWEEALARWPRNVGAYSQVASAMLTNNLYDRAIEVYRRGRRALRQESLFGIEIANAYANQGKFSQATKEFLIYVEKNPRQMSYILRRILTYIDANPETNILQTVRKFVQSREMPSPQILEIYENCLKRHGKFAEAFEVVDRLEALKAEKENARGSGRELLEFAQEAAWAGKHAIARKAYEKLISHWPDSPYRITAQIGLSDSYLREKNYAQAMAILDDIIQEHKNPNFVLQAYLEKGAILLDDLNDPEKAISCYQYVFDHFTARRIRLQAALALGKAAMRLVRFDSATEWFEKALHLLDAESAKERNEIYYMLAELSFSQKRFSACLKYLDQIEQVNFSAAQEDFVNDALEFAFLVESSLPDSAGSLSQYAVYKRYALARNNERALEALEVLLANDPQSPLAPRALLDLAGLYGKMQQAELEIGTYRRILADYPTSIYLDTAAFFLARALEKHGRPGEAVKAYEDFLAAYPQSIYLEEARHNLRALRDKAIGTFP